MAVRPGFLPPSFPLVDVDSTATPAWSSVSYPSAPAWCSSLGQHDQNAGRLSQYPPAAAAPSLESLCIAEALQTLTPSFEHKKRLVLATQKAPPDPFRVTLADGSRSIFRPPGTGPAGVVHPAHTDLGRPVNTEAEVQQQIRRLIASNRARAEASGHRLTPASTAHSSHHLDGLEQTGPSRIKQVSAFEVSKPSLSPTNLNPHARTFFSASSAAPSAVKPVRAFAKVPASVSSWWDRSSFTKTAHAARLSSLEPVVSASGIILPPVTQAGEIRSLFTFPVPFRPFPDCQLPSGPAKSGSDKQRSAARPLTAHSASSATKICDGDRSRPSDALSAVHTSEKIEERLQLVLQKYGAGPVAGQADVPRSRTAKRRARRKAVRFSDSSSNSLESSTGSLSASRSSSVSATTSADTPPRPAISSGRDLLQFRDDCDLLGSSEEEGEVILIGKLVDADVPLDEDDFASSGHIPSADLEQPFASTDQDFLAVGQLYNAVQRETGSNTGTLEGSREGFCCGAIGQQPAGPWGQGISAKLGQGFVTTAAKVPSGKARSERQTSRFGSLATLDDSPDGRHPPRGRKGPLILGDDLTPFSHLMRNLTVRQEIPTHVRHSPAGDLLQDGMIESWAATEPTAQEKQMIPDLCGYLTQVVNQHMGGYVGMRHGQAPRFEVDVFGSMSWGGQTGQTGDIDMVVRDRLLPQGYVPSLWKNPPEEEETEDAVFGSTTAPHLSRDNLPSCYDARRLGGILRNVAGFGDAIPIVHASTPIVKFTATLGDKEYKCDLNVNDVGGWYNSRLILAYCDLSPYVLRPMVHALKLWAGVNGLNDASGAKGPATMSSYCLTLMAIAYLQHRGHLPNLQAEVLAPIPDRLQDDARDVVWCSWGKPQATKAHVGFNRMPPPGWQPREPHLTAAEALRGFFAFYAHPSSHSQGARPSHGAFDYDRQVISVLHGGVLLRSEPRGQEEGEGSITKLERFRREGVMGKGDLGIQPDIWKFRMVVVQDPFIWPKNCSQSLSAIGKDRWFAAIDAANEMLAQGGKAVGLSDLLVQFAPMPTTLSKSAKRRAKANEAEARRASAAQQQRHSEAVEGDLLNGLHLAL